MEGGGAHSYQHPVQKHAKSVLTSLPVNRQGLRDGRSRLVGREEKCFSASFTTSSWSTPRGGGGGGGGGLSMTYWVHVCVMWKTHHQLQPG